MYSQTLQSYVVELGQYAGVDSSSISLLNEALACFLAVFGGAIGADTLPKEDFLTTSVRLLLLSDGLEQKEVSARLDGSHYLAGLGFEQTGEMLARIANARGDTQWSPPLDSDHWYRLTLAMLHYLAGGHRVQALGVLRHLEAIAASLKETEYGGEYRVAASALRRLYTGRLQERVSSFQFASWENLIAGRQRPTEQQEIRLYRLAAKIRQRRDEALGALGLGREQAWIQARGIAQDGAEFWQQYLTQLEERGITTFTPEQVGPGFDQWLRSGRDLLVVLPTGSGKSIIGELRSALSLAARQQVLWMLPTRALVRQTKREFRRAFKNMEVEVEELPTTEDFLPLFADPADEVRHVAVTTPEKLAALLRANPTATDSIGLIVLDEAQILLDKSRGTTVEFILQSLRRRLPGCDFILMTAFGEHKDVLRSLLQRMEDRFVPLMAETRPTRRVYGILTSDGLGSRQHPLVLMYPPGLQQESGKTLRPFEMTLPSTPLPSDATALTIAQRFIKASRSSPIKTVLFVNRKDSTETQASEIAKDSRLRRQSDKTQLPTRDVARLRCELGRISVIEETASAGVAPHHAGLTPLEQHLVEEWLRHDVLRIVVATPTLAQGVNLPFDVSIVASTQRYNRVSRAMEEMSYSEILNMIGRAGRAGYVSDGIGLVAVDRAGRTPQEALDGSRRFFFRTQIMSAERMGLSRLLTLASQAGVAAENWLMELGGATFSEVQGLVAFVVEATAGVDDVRQVLINRMMEFPSVQSLLTDTVELAAADLSTLVQNLRRAVADNEILLAALTRTGMPLELLRHFVEMLEGGSYAPSMIPSDKIVWADEVVRSGLQHCKDRAWYASLIGDLDLEPMFQMIRLWREGAPLVQLEAIWQVKPKTKANRIKIGEFLNHKLSLIAQLWGALAVCEELVLNLPTSNRSERVLAQMPTFVREGVGSLEELEWLRAIGGMDRVLAHELARVVPWQSSFVDRRMFVRSHLYRWRRDRSNIPTGFAEPFRSALLGALDD
jgi:superfamily II DNA/RNA helicase